MTLAVSEAIELDFEVQGEGEPIVFIPGLNDDRNGWAEVSPAFGGYQRLLIDNRDVGLSPRATAPYTIGDMADDVIRAMSRAGIGSAHIVGHSMGGTIAQELALRAPERVRSLVLVGTFARSDGYMQGAYDRWEYGFRNLPTHEFLKFTIPYWIGHDMIDEVGLDELAELFTGQVEAQGVEAFCRQLTATRMHDAVARLGQVKAPALVVAGEDDMLVHRSRDEELIGGLKNCRYVRIAGAGHSPTVEKPAELNSAMLSFYQSLAA